MIMKIPSNTGVFSDVFELDIDDGMEPIIDIDGGSHDNDFAEYLWMEDEEEFDKIEMQRLEEEELSTLCEEVRHDDLEVEQEQQHHLIDEEWTLEDSLELELTDIDVSTSTLNPLAQEFVPTRPIASQ